MILVFILVSLLFLIALNWTLNSIQWKNTTPSEPSYQPKSDDLHEPMEESKFREEYQFM